MKKNMKKVIRLTESDLTRIVRQVINETESDQQKQQLTAKITDCYSSTKYPKIAAALEVTGYGITAVILAIGGFATLEFGGLALMSLGASAATMTFIKFTDEFVAQTKVKKTPGLEAELKSLYNCIF